VTGETPYIYNIQLCCVFLNPVVFFIGATSKWYKRQRLLFVISFLVQVFIIIFFFFFLFESVLEKNSKIKNKKKIG
jgi:small neutral amino acid transporter SnatA (MarC family)